MRERALFLLMILLPLWGMSKRYKDKEVTIPSGDHSLAGTLSMPKGKGPHPALVMITGSGPQNRDESIFDFPIFGIIADALASNGVAVLRYDDQGFGASTGNFATATTHDHADDVSAAVDFLLKQERIDRQRVGLFGHSEGGVIAPIIASKRDDVAFLVLMAPVSIPLIDLLRLQSRLILEANGADSTEVKNQDLFLASVYRATESEDAWEAMMDSLRIEVEREYEDLPKDERELLVKEEFVNSTMARVSAQIDNPWYRNLVRMEPEMYLKEVHVPVLTLFGGKDLQVPADENQVVLERCLEAAGNGSYKTIVYPEANHLFQKAGSGSPMEYPGLPKEFVSGFLNDVVTWLREVNDL